MAVEVNLLSYNGRILKRSLSKFEIQTNLKIASSIQQWFSATDIQSFIT